MKEMIVGSFIRKFELNGINMSPMPEGEEP
jgi:hypothetical protein